MTRKDLKPDQPLGWADLVGLRMELGGQRTDGHRVERGIIDDKAAALDPQDAQLLSAAMTRMAFAGHREAVERYTDRALALTPDDPSLHVGKAWLKVLEGKLEEARAAMREG